MKVNTLNLFIFYNPSPPPKCQNMLLGTANNCNIYMPYKVENRNLNMIV